jgi:hypothetical protein
LVLGPEHTNRHIRVSFLLRLNNTYGRFPMAPTVKAHRPWMHAGFAAIIAAIAILTHLGCFSAGYCAGYFEAIVHYQFTAQSPPFIAPTDLRTDSY